MRLARHRLAQLPSLVEQTRCLRRDVAPSSALLLGHGLSLQGTGVRAVARARAASSCRSRPAPRRARPGAMGPGAQAVEPQRPIDDAARTACSRRRAHARRSGRQTSRERCRVAPPHESAFVPSLEPREATRQRSIHGSHATPRAPRQDRAGAGSRSVIATARDRPSIARGDVWLCRCTGRLGGVDVDAWPVPHIAPEGPASERRRCTCGRASARRGRVRGDRARRPGRISASGGGGFRPVRQPGYGGAARQERSVAGRRARHRPARPEAPERSPCGAAGRPVRGLVRCRRAGVHRHLPRWRARRPPCASSTATSTR